MRTGVGAAGTQLDLGKDRHIFVFGVRAKEGLVRADLTHRPTSAARHLWGLRTCLWCMFGRLQNVMGKGRECEFLTYTLDCFKFLLMCDGSWVFFQGGQGSACKTAVPSLGVWDQTPSSLLSNVYSPQKALRIGGCHWIVTKSIAHDKGCG